MGATTNALPRRAGSVRTGKAGSSLWAWAARRLDSQERSTTAFLFMAHRDALVAAAAVVEAIVQLLSPSSGIVLKMQMLARWHEKMSGWKAGIRSDPDL